MKKVFLFLSLILVIMIASVYGLLFTKGGNNIVASYIEQKANEQRDDVNLKVNDFTLTLDSINFDASINSISTIKVSGALDILRKSVDLKYDAKIKDLSKLQNFTKQKLNGFFETHGTFKGDMDISVINGNLKLANSNTDYNLKLVNFIAKDLKFDMQKAKIEELLHLINQPIYAKGLIDIKGNIKDLNISSLDGIVNTKITHGRLVNKIVNEKFKQSLKSAITFKGNVDTKLLPFKANSKVSFFTNLAKINIDEAIYDIKEGKFTSDYLLNIANLSKLQDITQTKMRGALSLYGDVTSSKEGLLVTGSSKLLGGNMDFKLENNSIDAKVKDLEIKKLTHMLYYPKIFDSKTNLDLNYNLLAKKGKLKGKLIKGHFLRNEFSSLINQFARFDITREIYDSVDINSDINDMVLKTKILMKSKNTQIDVKESLLDINKSFVDAKIQAKIKKVTLDFTVKGNMKSPKVRLDTKNLLKNELKNKIDEKLKDKLKNKLGDEKADELLNKFKKLF